MWQQRMNQVIEGLEHVEVIADDFLICGNWRKAMVNHDHNFKAFLSRARERGLKLN